MTPKERLQAALSGQTVDRPPCICPGGMMNMVTVGVMDASGVWLPAAHSNAHAMAALAHAVYEQGCFENVGVPFCMTVEAEAMGATVEMGTEAIEPHVVAYPLESAAGWRSLSAMDMDAGRAAVVLEAIRLLAAYDDGVPVVGNLTGPMSVVTSLVEPTVLYKEMRKKKQDVHDFLSFVTDELISFGLAQIEAGADVIAIADPSGTGEILGPKRFGEFMTPYLNRLVDAFSGHAKTIVHICGQMDSVYSELSQVRSDAFSFDAIVGVRRAKEELPGCAIVGNVSTYALEFATPEKVASLARACVRNGVNVVAPACGLGMRSPLENIQAIIPAVADGERGERGERGELDQES